MTDNAREALRARRRLWGLDYAEVTSLQDVAARLGGTVSGLIAACADEARRQGWDGDGAYALTKADCEWIISQWGRRPTLAEWTEAGYPDVGSAHVAEESLRAAAATLGRKGGRAKSEKKTLAVRQNGRLGGRPRKTS